MYIFNFPLFQLQDTGFCCICQLQLQDSNVFGSYKLPVKIIHTSCLNLSFQLFFKFQLPFQALP